MIKQGVVVVVAASLLWGCGGGPKPVDPCAGVNCGEGRCALVDEAPACLCAPGFVALGLSCTAVPPTDLCASNPCASLTNSLCQVNAGRVSCVCPASRVEVGGSCVLRTSCVPNPCENPHRTTCEPLGGVASCRCDPGYAPLGDGCSPAPVWTCAAQHATGDAAEPDECPTLARPLIIDVEDRRTLEPAGDHDWFELGVTPGHLFSFTATADSATPLLIEVFDSAGLTLLASDNRGAAAAEVSFVAPGEQTLMVRVRGIRASDTGGYAVRYRELGVDDYVNTTADAITLVPGSPFAGTVQYAGDRDVVWLEMPAMTAVRFAVADGGLQDLVIEVERPDGGLRTLGFGEATAITTSTVERLSITAKGRNPRNEGGFWMALEELGPDDHSDDPTFGTPLPNNLAVSGRFERPNDIDSFLVNQLADRLYRVSWQGQQGSTPQVTVLLANGQVAGTSGYYGTTAIVWKADQSRPAAVRVQQPYSTTGGFTVAVEDLGLDDHSDDLGNATPATHGVPVAGRLELATDVDTFSFTAVAGRIMQATALRTGTGTTVPLHLTVYDPQGIQLGEADGTVGMLASVTGVYKVQVERGGYSSTTDLVGYTLTVVDQGQDDHAATSTGATALTVGTPSLGSVQYATDIDAFAFTAVAGHVYQVTCTRNPGTCSYQVKDPSGAPVVSGGSSATTSFLTATAGRYVIEVGPGSSYSPALGPYSLTVTDLGVEDHGSTTATATALTVGTPITGTIGFSQDLDAFSFAAVSGHIYGATLTPSNGNVRLEVRDSANGLVASSYGSTVSFIALASGTYYVFVSSYFSTTASPYSLTVADRGVDDHSNTSTGATALTIGTGTTGDIQYQSDLDFFSAAVVAGHHHQVTCTVTSGSCNLSVIDSFGTVLASGYSGSPLAFKPASTLTTAFIRVSSSSESARYTVLVSDLGADDHGDVRADATALTIDAAATAGVLETNADQDAFTVTAGAGEIVTLTCTTTSGTACGLVVTSPSGGSIVQAQYSTLTRTGFLASAPGSYLVQVRGSGYSTGAYTLAAARSSDDFTTTTPLVSGVPTAGAINYVGDTDVFSITLTQGVAAQVTLSTGARATITSPTGGYMPSVYGGYVQTIMPIATGTYLFSVAGDSYYGVLTSYTLTVQ